MWTRIKKNRNANEIHGTETSPGPHAEIFGESVKGEWKHCHVLPFAGTIPQCSVAGTIRNMLNLVN